MKNKKCPLCPQFLENFEVGTKRSPSKDKLICNSGHLFILRFKEGVIGKQELVVESNPDNPQDKGKCFDCD